jgi:hypothetical protein
MKRWRMSRMGKVAITVALICFFNTVPGGYALMDMVGHQVKLN